MRVEIGGAVTETEIYLNIALTEYFVEKPNYGGLGARPRPKPPPWEILT